MPRPGEHVVVIGGTSNLGLDIAKAAAALGARVTVAGRHRDKAAAAASVVGAGTGVCTCDLTDWESVHRMFAEIDTVDHLILTALDRDHNTIKDFRADDSARTMLMKTVGYAVAVQAALPKFTDTGSVVLFSGLSMWTPMPGSTTISMANGGVIGLMNSLATQVAPVRVNAVTPGVVVGTAAVDTADPIRAEQYERLRQRTPGKRLPTTADIVAATFALTDNQGLNAANLVVDAGMHLA